MPSLADTRAIGRYGERVAAAFLRRHGFRILTRNFQAVAGEIDLVCREGPVLAFVEVRSRSSEQFGRPAESIDARKEQAFVAAANEYLRLLRRDDVDHRFDAVEVQLRPGAVPACTLIRNILA
jgi:putative endonuclease